MLKDIRDSLAGNVIIPSAPPIPNDNGDDNGNDDGDDNGNDDGDDNGSDDGDDRDDKKSFIELSWINDLQLYKKIASEVFSRYIVDKDSFELFTLRTFIGNINNECVKNKKDAREEFKTIKKNVKSEPLKQIVKELEQAIFGYDDDKDKEELEGADELDKRFRNLISKKRLEAFKEYSKKAEYIDPQIRVNALRKKLNNLPEASSDETSDDNNNNNDNDDSEDNQISNFVNRVLKKVSKEIVKDDNKNNDNKNDDNKNDDNKNNDNKNDDNKNDDNKKLLKLSKKNAVFKK